MSKQILSLLYTITFQQQKCFYFHYYYFYLHYYSWCTSFLEAQMKQSSRKVFVAVNGYYHTCKISPVLLLLLLLLYYHTCKISHFNGSQHNTLRVRCKNIQLLDDLHAIKYTFHSSTKFCKNSFLLVNFLGGQFFMHMKNTFVPYNLILKYETASKLGYNYT